MIVFSGFNGMNCGRIAFERAGIEVDKYYSSEIDKYANEVTNYHYPDTIQVGDIRNVNAEDYKNIDILIGGSSCQNFSFAGKRNGMILKNNIEITSYEQYMQLKEEGFEFEGYSYLFWEYVRLLKELKPKYFLLENVVMAKKWENIITDALGIEPIMIDSSLLSAQSRKRLYWTNIPNVTQPEDKGLYIKDILDDTVDDNLYINDELLNNQIMTRNYMQYDIFGKGHRSQSMRAYYKNSKAMCLNTKCSSDNKLLEEDGRVRVFSVNELERLQTVPENYFNGVKRGRVCKMLGNGWTVDVIAHIFSFLPKEYKKVLDNKTE